MSPSSFDEQELFVFGEQLRMALFHLRAASRQWNESQALLRLIEYRLDVLEEEIASLRSTFQKDTA
jgi:hypothetical protein